MKKALFIVILFVGGIDFINAQNSSGSNFKLNDSVIAVKNTKDNSIKLRILNNIVLRFIFSQGDSAIKYAKLAEEIAILSKNDRALYRFIGLTSTTHATTLGNYPLSLHFATEQLKIGQKLNLNDSLLRSVYYNLAFSYAYLQNKDLAYKYLNLVWPLKRRTMGNGLNVNLAKAYYILGKYDSAYYYSKIITITKNNS